MQPHPTPDRAHSPAPPLTPDVFLRDDRAADLDRRARVACATRLVFGLSLRREAAVLAANDVIDTYLEQTMRPRC